MIVEKLHGNINVSLAKLDSDRYILMSATKLNGENVTKRMEGIEAAIHVAKAQGALHLHCENARGDDRCLVKVFDLDKIPLAKVSEIVIGFVGGELALLEAGKQVSLSPTLQIQRARIDSSDVCLLIGADATTPDPALLEKAIALAKRSGATELIGMHDQAKEQMITIKVLAAEAALQELHTARTHAKAGAALAAYAIELKVNSFSPAMFERLLIRGIPLISEVDQATFLNAFRNALLDNPRKALLIGNLRESIDTLVKRDAEAKAKLINSHSQQTYKKREDIYRGPPLHPKQTVAKPVEELPIHPKQTVAKPVEELPIHPKQTVAKPVEELPIHPNAGLDVNGKIKPVGQISIANDDDGSNLTARLIPGFTSTPFSNGTGIGYTYLNKNGEPAFRESKDGIDVLRVDEGSIKGALAAARLRWPAPAVLKINGSTAFKEIAAALAEQMGVPLRQPQGMFSHISSGARALGNAVAAARIPIRIGLNALGAIKPKTTVSSDNQNAESVVPKPDEEQTTILMT